MAGKISLPHQSIVAQWKEEKVIKWLKKMHLDDCIPAFEIRHIDGTKLLDLTEQKLFTYQDMKIKHRKQIAKCVQECKTQATSAKRLAQTIRKNNKSDGTEKDDHDVCDSEDSDDWGSDFEDDSEDEIKDDIESELNNNTIVQTLCESPMKDSVEQTSSLLGNSSHRVKFIPQPPDIPLISQNINVSTGLKNCNHSSSIPRQPLKRPPSQPPPPPVSQASSSHSESLEDYEKPIISSNSSDNNNVEEFVDNLSSNGNLINEEYELIEPPEENYEIVDAPPPLKLMPEKPQLPPRLPLNSVVASAPPPLPQKPRKLKDSLIGKTEDTRTFSRPKIFTKQEESLADTVRSESLPNNIGFINSLIGRRSSNTPSPKVEKKNKELQGDSSSFSSSTSVFHSGVHCSPPNSSVPEAKKMVPLPPLPSHSTLSFDETVQNMATRPLPPVPVLNENKGGKGEILSNPWYHEIEREDAEKVVRSLNESGSFVVRPSKRAGQENPFSLTVLHEGKIFHLNIRLRPDNTFALGKEKRKEKTFKTVAELIAFHQTEPILLTSRGESAGKTVLNKYPEKNNET